MMKKLVEIMKAKEVTSAFLADKIGISKVSMSNIVTGKSIPGIDKVQRIAAELGVTVSEILGEVEYNKGHVCPHCGKELIIEIK